MSTSADRPRTGGRLRLPRRGQRLRGRSDDRRRLPWSRLLPVLAVVLAVVATFVVILLMTVRITDGQYRLVELRREEQALQQESESLTQDLEFHRAPQNLARAAQEEGLVPAPSEQGVVDLSTGEVTGQAEPAAEADGEEIDIAVPPPVQSGSSAAEQAAQQARERRDALPSTDEEAQDQLDSARAAEADVDLHGGTIPAPQQRPGSTGGSDEDDDAAAADSASADDAPPADGNPEAPEGHTPLSGPVEVPQPQAPADADDPVGADPVQEGAAQDGAAQNGAPQDEAAQDGTAGEGAGQ